MLLHLEISSLFVPVALPGGGVMDASQHLHDAARSPHGRASTRALLAPAALHTVADALQ
jgi:hypothetical protein